MFESYVLVSGLGKKYALKICISYVCSILLLNFSNCNFFVLCSLLISWNSSSVHSPLRQKWHRRLHHIGLWLCVQPKRHSSRRQVVLWRWLRTSVSVDTRIERAAYIGCSAGKARSRIRREYCRRLFQIQSTQDKKAVYRTEWKIYVSCDVTSWTRFQITVNDSVW